MSPSGRHKHANLSVLKEFPLLPLSDLPFLPFPLWPKEISHCFIFSPLLSHNNLSASINLFNHFLKSNGLLFKWSPQTSWNICHSCSIYPVRRLLRHHTHLKIPLNLIIWLIFTKCKHFSFFSPIQTVSSTHVATNIPHFYVYLLNCQLLS